MNKEQVDHLLKTEGVLVITDVEGFAALKGHWAYFNKINGKDFQKITDAIEKIQEGCPARLCNGGSGCHHVEGIPF
jgi:hypothetical protein